MINCEFCKHFAINFDILGFYACDEARVGNTFGLSGIIDTGNPNSAKIAFFVATIAIRIAKGFNHTLFSKTKTAGAVMLHPFSGFKDFLMFLTGWNASFNSHVRLLGQILDF